MYSTELSVAYHNGFTQGSWNSWRCLAKAPKEHATTSFNHMQQALDLKEGTFGVCFLSCLCVCTPACDCVCVPTESCDTPPHYEGGDGRVSPSVHCCAAKGGGGQAVQIRQRTAVVLW